MKRISSFLAGVGSTILVASITIGALALSGKVSFNPVNVSLNGKQVGKAGETYTTSSGTEVPYSIVYTDEKGGGTTYLPVRKVSELLNIKINWNQEENTVEIGETPTDTDVTDEFIQATLVKIDDKYYTLAVREINLSLVTYGDEQLIFVPDIIVHKPDIPFTHILDEFLKYVLESDRYVILDIENPYFDGMYRYETYDVDLKDYMTFGTGETQYISPTESFTPQWYEYNGKRVYQNTEMSDEVTVSENGIRYYKGGICMNDLFRYFGINKKVQVGKRYDMWYYEIVDA